MKFLIVTQAIDLDDPVLGFFHRWVEEFSKHCESVHVICLKEGRHSLPANVSVHSLGKEHVYRIPYTVYRIRFVQRIRYVLRFWSYIWKLRNEYDAIFVHMNQEYVLLGGKFWWLLGKRVILWRNHKMGSAWTRIAGFFAHTMCYTSPEAYVAKFKNAIKMPIGIDTDFFKPSAVPAPAGTILFLGRLDAVKKPDMFLHAMGILRRDGISVHADVYGDPTPGRESFARKLKSDFASFKRVSFHRAVRNDETPGIYNAHAIYVNLTPSGSFDKTIGEAMACGSVVVAANDAVRSAVPPACMVDSQSAESVAAGMRAAIALSEDKRRELAKKLRAYVVREHSLRLLAERMFGILAT